MDAASNTFDSEVLAYEGICSKASDILIQIGLATQTLDTHVAHLKTIILTSYPHVLPMEADVNIFSTLASILRERQLDFSKLDEEALEDLARWGAKFTSGAVEVLSTLHGGRQHAKIIGQRVPLFKASPEEQIEILHTGAASLRAGMAKVGTKDLGLIDQEIKDMATGSDALQQQAWGVQVDRFPRV